MAELNAAGVCSESLQTCGHWSQDVETGTSLEHATSLKITTARKRAHASNDDLPTRKSARLAGRTHECYL